MKLCVLLSCFCVAIGCSPTLSVQDGMPIGASLTIDESTASSPSADNSDNTESDDVETDAVVGDDANSEGSGVTVSTEATGEATETSGASPDTDPAPEANNDDPPVTAFDARSSAIPATSTDNHFVSYTHLITDNPIKRRYGIAVTDYDLDGDFEAVVTGYGGANEVIDWRGGALVDISDPVLRDSDRRAIGVGACDLTGDGREEIYFLNVDRFGGLGEVSDRLFFRDGDGWSDAFELEANAPAINQFSGRSVACLDRFGSGQYGVFVANYGGPMKLFELDDEKTITDAAPAVGVALTTGGRGLVVLPGPQGLDLFAGNENGPNFFFRNNGDGTFNELAASLGVDDPFETVRGVTVLDANEDGRLDLVYGNWQGPHRLFIQGEDGQYVDQVNPGMARPSRIRTVIAADFDNDGTEELFWNNIGEPNRVFGKRDGAWTQLPIGDALETDGLGTGAAVLDIDGDGVLELLVAHGESGAQPLSVFRWGNTDNHYLRIFPKTRFGAPARGTTVKIRHASGRQQVRVIDSGSGYLCQMEPVAHFGLGPDPDVVSVDIIWPDGSTVTINGPDIDTRIDVAHPGSGSFQ